jgi:hypothetical protein
VVVRVRGPPTRGVTDPSTPLQVDRKGVDAAGPFGDRTEQCRDAVRVPSSTVSTDVYA